jgi:hypothetical protein
MKRVFLSYSYDRDSELVSEVKLRLRESMQFEILDPSESAKNGYNAAFQISSGIQRASIVVSFMSTINPTVFYETGLAIGAGKNVLVVGREPDALPGDLKQLPLVVLTGDVETDAAEIVNRLQKLQVLEEQPTSNYISVQEKMEAYWSDRAYFDAMSPMEFEELIFEWLSLNNFEPERSNQPLFYGIDLIARAPNDQSLIAVEMKKFSRQSRVSVKEVMALLGAATLIKAEKAALITSSTFTAAAMEMAKRSSGLKLYLLTVDDLLASRDPSSLFR